MSSLLSTILVALLVLTSCSFGGPAGGTAPPVEPIATPTSAPTPVPTRAPIILPPEPTGAPVESIWIPAAGGGITVRVVPRGDRAIPFHRLDSTRWAFYGNQENLVGQAYEIELENTTSSRAKIVVGAALGKWVLGKFNLDLAEHKFWPVVTGVSIIALVIGLFEFPLLPLGFFGCLLNFAVVLFGLGALWLWGRERLRMQPAG